MALCEPWATADDLCAPCLDVYSLDAYELSDYLQQASEILYMLSGQTYSGSCSETIAPCNRQLWAFDGTLRFSNGFFQGDDWGFLSPWNPFPWSGSPCGCHSWDTCSCSHHPVIELPRSTIQSIDTVEIDGDTLDPSQYELRDNLLARIDGLSWPCCTDTLFITYTYGRPPPRSGVKAAAVLACELLIACDPAAVPNAKCRLPPNVSSITRQGVSVIFNSLTRVRGPFRFGIWEIDLFLEAFEGNREMAIVSPDIPQVRRVP